VAGAVDIPSSAATNGMAKIVMATGCLSRPAPASPGLRIYAGAVVAIGPGRASA
jgi:hypothetical protein